MALSSTLEEAPQVVELGQRNDEVWASWPTWKHREPLLHVFHYLTLPSLGTASSGASHLTPPRSRQRSGSTGRGATAGRPTRAPGARSRRARRTALHSLPTQRAAPPVTLCGPFLLLVALLADSPVVGAAARAGRSSRPPVRRGAQRRAAPRGVLGAKAASRDGQQADGALQSGQGQGAKARLAQAWRPGCFERCRLPPAPVF
jgi:hypothetical protein